MNGVHVFAVTETIGLPSAMVVVFGAVVTFSIGSLAILAAFEKLTGRLGSWVAGRVEDGTADLREKLATVQREVTFNGGTSLKDAVREIDRRLTRMEGRAEERWHAQDEHDGGV